MSKHRHVHRHPAPIQIVSARVSRAIGKNCLYCEIRMSGRGLSKPTREHIHPRVLGGGPVVMACLRCNGGKSDLTLPEWLERLRAANDYRWKTVAKLIDDLAAGRVWFAPTDTGLTIGVFA